MYSQNDFRYYVQGPYLAHHGIKGQRWGVRRYQNDDGTLTEAGKKRLSDYKSNESERVKKRIVKTYEKIKKSGEKDFRYEKRKKDIENARKELKAIEKMKYKDMVAEKRLVGAKRIATIMATSGWVALNWSAWNAPSSIAGLVAMPSTSKIKTAVRLGKEKERKTYERRREEIQRMYSATGKVK